MDKAFAKSQTHQLSIQLYHKNENSNAPSGFFFNMKTTIRNLPSSKRCLDQVPTFIITIAQIHNACKMLSSTSTWCKSNKKCRRNYDFSLNSEDDPCRMLVTTIQTVFKVLVLENNSKQSIKHSPC